MKWRDKTDKRNFIFLTADGALYFTALAFIDVNILIPLFLNNLTHSPLLVGLAAAVRSVGFFLPQILTAGWVTGAKNLNRFIFWLHLMTRTPLILASIAIWLDFPSSWVAGIFLITFTLFAFGEGIGQVPWIDIFGRTIDESHRGKLFGYMQALGGLGALAGGFIVQRVLASPNWDFPRNFALLFSIALIFLLASAIAIRFAKDPPKEIRGEQRLSTKHVITHIPQYLREHPVFSRMLFVQILTGFNVLGFPFYILYVQQTGFLPAWLVGVLVMVQVLGQVIGGLLLGFLSDRLGNRKTIIFTVGLNVLVPLLVLWSSTLTATLSTMVTLAAFLSLGIVVGGWLGFINYLMEITPQEKRPIYVSLSNLFASPVGLLPILTGAFLNLINVVWIFIAVAAIEIAAFTLAFRLPEPREKQISLTTQPAPARRPHNE